MCGEGAHGRGLNGGRCALLSELSVGRAGAPQTQADAGTQDDDGCGAATQLTEGVRVAQAFLLVSEDATQIVEQGVELRLIRCGADLYASAEGSREVSLLRSQAVWGVSHVAC